MTFCRFDSVPHTFYVVNKNNQQHKKVIEKKMSVQRLLTIQKQIVCTLHFTTTIMQIKT